MTIHQQVHPTFVEGCWKCKVGSVAIGVAALPTRKPEANRQGDWWAQKQKDMGAYRTLRDEGLQPPSIEGSHQRMMTATESWQVEGKPELWGRRDESRTGTSPDMGVKDAP